MVAVATGRPITADLAVGPDLSTLRWSTRRDGDEDDEVAAVDQAMSWLVDFDAAAEQVGMALRLPVAGPVDLLLVTGRPRRGAGRGASLAALLDAQRYTAGLGFVDPGTLTNNTEDGPAGWSSAGGRVAGAPPSGPPAPGTSGALAASASRDTTPGRCRARRLTADDAPGRAMSTRAVAGDVGVLAAAVRGGCALADDATGRATTRGASCGPAARCRRCAWVASRTGCCP